MQQIDDLREEGDVLFAFLDTLAEDQWQRETPFKSRTSIGWCSICTMQTVGPSIP